MFYSQSFKIIHLQLYGYIKYNYNTIFLYILVIKSLTSMTGVYQEYFLTFSCCPLTRFDQNLFTFLLNVERSFSKITQTVCFESFVDAALGVCTSVSVNPTELSCKSVTWTHMLLHEPSGLCWKFARKKVFNPSFESSPTRSHFLSHSIFFVFQLMWTCSKRKIKLKFLWIPRNMKHLNMFNQKMNLNLKQEAMNKLISV